MYSLWRNNIQLGSLLNLVYESDEDGEPMGFWSILSPMVNVDNLREVRQTRFADIEGSPSIHQYREPPEAMSPGTASPYVPVYPLTPFMLYQQNGAVAEEEVFYIRTNDGLDVPTYGIGILPGELSTEPDQSDDLRALGLPEDSRTIFQVLVAYESADPSRKIPQEMKDQILDLLKREEELRKQSEDQSE